MANGDIFVSNNIPIDVEFGQVFIVTSGDAKVYYATTATWNGQPQLITERGSIYVYSDYTQNEQQQNVPAIKVGDGSAYLIDMPFTSDLMYDHISNSIIHVTQAEKDVWNGKVRCYLDGEHNLVFTTN